MTRERVEGETYHTMVSVSDSKVCRIRARRRIGDARPASSMYSARWTRIITY